MLIILNLSMNTWKKIPDMDKFGSIPIPMTQYQQNLCELSITPIESFIKDIVSNTEKNYIRVFHKRVI